MPRLPHDYSAAAAAERTRFLEMVTGTSPEHLGRDSVDPAMLAGNIENFVGTAQVPLGIAGPLLVHGEHAEGEFYVPMATTEGTLVASYNRGMKLLHRAGGVTTTVMDDRMQRAPVFGFDSAREARTFGQWVAANLDKKSSQINILDTRGKRVTAEATIAQDLIREIMHTTPEEMFRARQAPASAA